MVKKSKTKNSSVAGRKNNCVFEFDHRYLLHEEYVQQLMSKLSFVMWIKVNRGSFVLGILTYGFCLGIKVFNRR